MITVHLYHELVATQLIHVHNSHMYACSSTASSFAQTTSACTQCYHHTALLATSFLMGRIPHCKLQYSGIATTELLHGEVINLFINGTSTEMVSMTAPVTFTYGVLQGGVMQNCEKLFFFSVSAASTIGWGSPAIVTGGFPIGSVCVYIP